MKNMKRILGLVMVAALLFGSVSVFADTLPASEKQDRFKIFGDSANQDAFSMISSDGNLVIDIDENTPMVFEDGFSVRERLQTGQTLQNLLDGREMIVTYSTTKQSLPPRTSPDKIVLLYEKAIPLPEKVDSQIPLTLNGEIVVGGSIIEAPASYVEGETVMVPLRAVAEKLGFDVTWDNKTKGIRLGVAINLWIGKDSYTVGKMAPIELGVAPVLKDGHTYVPLSFFQTVLSGYDAAAFEGQVVIEKSEKAEL